MYPWFEKAVWSWYAITFYKMANNLDVLYLSRLDDMEEGWVAPLFVASHHPTIGVTGDPDQIIAMHWFRWTKPDQHQQKKPPTSTTLTVTQATTPANIQMFKWSKDPKIRCSPDNKGLIRSNGFSISRLSCLSNCSILLGCPKLNKPGSRWEKKIYISYWVLISTTTTSSSTTTTFPTQHQDQSEDGTPRQCRCRERSVQARLCRPMASFQRPAFAACCPRRTPHPWTSWPSAA